MTFYLSPGVYVQDIDLWKKAVDTIVEIGLTTSPSPELENPCSEIIPMYVQVQTDQELWQKENMVNIGLQTLMMSPGVSITELDINEFTLGKKATNPVGELIEKGLWQHLSVETQMKIAAAEIGIDLSDPQDPDAYRYLEYDDEYNYQLNNSLTAYEEWINKTS